jgi:UPF0716 family protein affecting phage T7 exclusion
MSLNYLAHGLVAIVALFFVAGGVINIVAPEHIRQDYARWGYPSGFHILTGGLELAAAVLIVFPSTRLIGSLLGAAIMVAAVATLVWHGSFSRAIVPVVALVFVATNALLAYR